MHHFWYIEAILIAGLTGMPYFYSLDNETFRKYLRRTIILTVCLAIPFLIANFIVHVSGLVKPSIIYPLLMIWTGLIINALLFIRRCRFRPTYPHPGIRAFFTSPPMQKIIAVFSVATVITLTLGLS